MKRNFYLFSFQKILINDLYDLLYEKMDTITYSGNNPPEYFQSEKYYAMGSGIAFPLVMHYRAEEQQSSSAEDYFYYLNGHNDVTCFADQNLTPELIETYEYNLLRLGSKV